MREEGEGVEAADARAPGVAIAAVQHAREQLIQRARPRALGVAHLRQNRSPCSVSGSIDLLMRPRRCSPARAKIGSTRAAHQAPVKVILQRSCCCSFARAPK